MDTIMEMKEAGYEPTERTYNHVLRACRETEVRQSNAERRGEKERELRGREKGEGGD